MFWRCALTALCLSAMLRASVPVDVPRTFALLKEGEQLTSERAADLEARIVHKPGDEEDRIRLLSFYAHQQGTEATQSIRAARLRHISWLAERDPKAAIFDVATGVYTLQEVGGPLADPTGFQSVRDIWQSQIKAHPNDLVIKRNAVSFLQIQDPELAATLLLETGDSRWRGQVYAKAVLGIVAVDYISGEPVLVDDARRSSPFGIRASETLENSKDPVLLGGAVFTLCRDGGILYAAGKLSGDYISTADRLLAKTQAMDPNNSDVFSAIPELPNPGEPPPEVVRLGAPAARAKLLSQVDPTYPPQAQADLVEGVVRLNVLIGLDGRVLKVSPVSGPDPLRSAAANAVKQWIYSPTRLKGRAVYVFTVIDVRFQQ